MLKNITTIQHVLGECPLWVPEEGKLYWMDLVKPALYACSFTQDGPGEVRSWDMPEALGGLALRQSGGLVIGMQRRVAAFQPGDGTVEDLALFDGMTGAVRFNDGKCDSRGRFLLGNMLDPSLLDPGQEESSQSGHGGIFALDPDHSVRVVETGLAIPNGFTWNLDESLLYLADTDLDTIFAYDYDPEHGTLGDRRIFASTGGMEGSPDGSCLDSEGCLWNAIHGGGKVLRFYPDGTVADSIELPVRYPTCVAFGGPYLTTLFITTSSQDLDPEEKKRQPLAGTVLAVDVGVRGAPVYPYGG